MKTNLLKNEQGRSMVEMLGVLTIMGILSVAGMSAFKSAMTRHRANELMNAISMRLMTLAAQRAQGTQLSLSEFGTGKVGSSTISVDTANTNAIVLSLSDVPAAVCQNMFNTKGANVVKMTSNGVELTSASDCVDGKVVTITFNNDLAVENMQQAQKSCIEDASICTGGRECTSGVCQCPEQQEGQTYWNGTECVLYEDCPYVPNVENSSGQGFGGKFYGEDACCPVRIVEYCECLDEINPVNTGFTSAQLEAYCKCIYEDSKTDEECHSLWPA